MNPFELGAASFVVVLVLIFLRIPIGLAMLIVGLGGNYLMIGSPIMIMGQLKNLTYSTFSNYSFSIIPLFLLMGQFAALGGLSKALFEASDRWIGHIRGGAAVSSVAACAGFGAICGSSLATAATMGQTALPELRRAGYSGALSTGVLAAGGTLGILIPPSVILVIYAILTEQNIVKLFMAAVVPGLLAALGYVLTVAIYVLIRPRAGGKATAVPLADKLWALLKVWPVVLLFLLVIGGLYLGWFTPTEAAAIGALGTGIMALFAGMRWQGLRDAILRTAEATGMIFLILLGAAVYNGFLALTQMPQGVAHWVGGLGLSPWVILIAVLALYLVFGCVMDSLSMVMLTVPILFPVMMGLDFGLAPEAFALWFGILVLIVVETGLITPPVGMNLFVINKLAGDVPMVETYKGVLPFVLSDLLRVALLVAFPGLTLWLVEGMF